MATKHFIGGVITVLALGTMVPGAGAQEYGAAGGPAFSSLTPGNRIIARALYEAQGRNVGGLIPRWTLEQLAAARKDGRDWDAIFLQMKDAGLLKATDFGYVLSAYHRPQVVKAADGAPERATEDGIATATAGQASHSDASLQKFTPGPAGIGGASATADGHSAGQGGGVSGGHGHGRGR